jgi:hypothetical protein
MLDNWGYIKNSFVGIMEYKGILKSTLWNIRAYKEIIMQELKK